MQLLFVHGTLSHYRLSRLIKYSFYKNIVFCFMLFFFQFYNGYSGAPPIQPDLPPPPPPTLCALCRIEMPCAAPTATIPSDSTTCQKMLTGCDNHSVHCCEGNVRTSGYGLPGRLPTCLRKHYSECRLHRAECGATGQALVDGVTAAVYNVIFTSVPILLYAVLDRPVKHFVTLIRYPQVPPSKGPGSRGPPTVHAEGGQCKCRF